jgi:glycosyltransferase domain-containing protein
MIKYSIIIPTHNRHNLMQKNIDYFGKFKACHIYICDSTIEVFNGEFPINITYLHMPNQRFVEKMATTLTAITTDFVAVCADDDFLIEDTVQHLINELDHNKYIMGLGRHLGFLPPSSSLFQLYTDRKMPTYNGDSSSLDRSKYYCSNYYMCLWAVFNSKVLLDVYLFLLKGRNYHDDLIEIIIFAFFTLRGNICTTNKFLGIREVGQPNSWGKRVGRFYMLQDEEINKNISNLRLKPNELYLETLIWTFVYAERKSFSNKKVQVKNYLEVSLHPYSNLISKYYLNNATYIKQKSSAKSFFPLEAFEDINLNEDKFKIDFLRAFYLQIDSLNKNEKYIIYGAGSVGKLVYSILKESVIAFVDKNIENQQTFIDSIPILSIQRIKEVKFDKVIICVNNSLEIKENLLNIMLLQDSQLIYI